jgi:DNA polymerase sigma
MLQRVLPKLETRRKEAAKRLQDLSAGRIPSQGANLLEPRRITEEQAARHFAKLLQGAPLLVELQDGTTIGAFDLTAAPPSSDSFAIAYDCPVCEESLKSKFELRMHITRRHLVNVKALKRLKVQSLIGSQLEPFNLKPISVESVLEASLSPQQEAILTGEIEENYHNRVLRTETLTSWLNEVARIQHSLAKVLPTAQLRPYGSSCNGFATISSDIDLTLDVDVIKHSFKSGTAKIRTEELYGPEETMDLAYKLVFDKLVVVLNQLGYVNIEERFEARIPIIKCINQDIGMEMDISLANLVAVENSLLLSTYSEIDIRAKHLGIALKTWAKSRRIGNPATHTLSSYSHLILLIAFLQTERLLPNLQAAYDNEYRIMRGDFDCSFEHDADLFRGQTAENRKSTGRLLFDFFKFYSVFDWRTNCVSIRAVKAVSKAEKQWTKTLIAIEDPFEVKRNLGDVCTRDTERAILNEFRRACVLLAAGQSFRDLCSEG